MAWYLGPPRRKRQSSPEKLPPTVRHQSLWKNRGANRFAQRANQSIYVTQEEEENARN